jgi:hypothetical protein
MPKLTESQRKILAQIRRGPRVYDGRSAGAIKHLEDLGLATARYDAEPSRGSHLLTVQRITVARAAAAADRLEAIEHRERQTSEPDPAA